MRYSFVQAGLLRSIAALTRCRADAPALSAIDPASGVIVQGWVAARNGDAAAGACIRQGMARAEAMGSQLFHPFYFGLLAEALALAGEIDEGISALDQVLANSAASGRKSTDVELHRLRGELL